MCYKKQVIYNVPFCLVVPGEYAGIFINIYPWAVLCGFFLNTVGTQRHVVGKGLRRDARPVGALEIVCTCVSFCRSRKTLQRGAAPLGHVLNKTTFCCLCVKKKKLSLD